MGWAGFGCAVGRYEVEKGPPYSVQLVKGVRPHEIGMHRSDHVPQLSPFEFEVQGSFDCSQASVRWNQHGRNTTHGPEHLRIYCAVPSIRPGQIGLGRPEPETYLAEDTRRRAAA